MPTVAIIIGAVLLLHLLIGIGGGVIMDPRGPWKDTFEVAAAGAGIVVVLLFLAILVGLFTHPSECTRAGCNDSDNAAGVQVVFLILLTPPIYALVLPGAALGRLLGRGVRRGLRGTDDNCAQV